jgi:hypothetical protein
MGGSSPKPTDPRSIAAAQTSSGIGTAVANTWLGNMNETNPYGSTTTTQTGSQSYTDPYTGQTYNIPTFTRNTTLDPTQQEILNNQNAANLYTARAGNEASQNLMTAVRNPMLPNKAPDPTVPTLQTSYETDFSADRQKVENALFSRLNPQLERDRTALESSLANKGVKLGSAAYDRAMQNFGQTTNDARTAAILNAGQEQSRLAGLTRDAAMFGNDALTSQYGLTAGERNRQMQEQLTLRNQSINEAAALRGGGSVTMPSFMGGNTGQIPTTDVAGLIGQNDQQRMQAYQQKQSNIGGMLSGLGGLAGLFMLSDARAKEDIEKIAETKDGMGLYSYRYKGDPKTQIGLMAQEVAKKKPKAVAVGGDGLMRVNYKEALR